MFLKYLAFLATASQIKYIKSNLACAWITSMVAMHSPLQKRESTGASFLYWLDWKSKISTEMLMNEKLPNQV